MLIKTVEKNQIEKLPAPDFSLKLKPKMSQCVTNHRAAAPTEQIVPNFRGKLHLNYTASYRCIIPRETIREERACFIGLSKTIKNSYTNNWYLKNAGYRKFPSNIFHQNEGLEGF
jgi:hypothetical protein